MLRKIVGIFGVIFFCVTSAAYADVPNPYGRPRPRPVNELHQFNILRISYFNEVEDQPGKVKLNFVVQAPQKAKINYSIKNEAGQLLLSESIESANGTGEFDVYLDRPAKNTDAKYDLEMDCLLNVIKTSFGYKLTDKPVYRNSIQRKIMLNNRNDNCDMEVE